MRRPASATVGDWLATRTPPPPELLRSRITMALGDALARDIHDTEHVCLEAAERVLSRLFADASGDRQEAGDLLAADALVTYALEFAAERPGEFSERATQALQRFGRLHPVRA